MKLLYIDCETTGVIADTHGLIQISGAIEIEGTIVEEFDIKSAPFIGDLIDDDALKINGIDRHTLNSYPKPAFSYRQFHAILCNHCDKFKRSDKMFMVGYNADFDSQFIRKWFEKNNDRYFGSFFWWPILDVAKLAGLRLMKTRHELYDFKLKTVARHLGISIDESRLHDAKYDIEVTIEMFRILVADIPQLQFMKNAV